MRHVAVHFATFCPEKKPHKHHRHYLYHLCNQQYTHPIRDPLFVLSPFERRRPDHLPLRHSFVVFHRSPQDNKNHTPEAVGQRERRHVFLVIPRSIIDTD
jgi:hypothetical protein